MRPEFVTDEHLRFLDVLREDAQINMFGASVPLRQVYAELSEAEARDVLKHWMATFRERHHKKTREFPTFSQIEGRE